MLKKEKKKNQDALRFSGTERSEVRHSQSSPLPPRNPEGPKMLLSSAPTQPQDLSTLGNRPNLLHGKAGQLTKFPLFFLLQNRFPHSIYKCTWMKVMLFIC